MAAVLEGRHKVLLRTDLKALINGASCSNTVEVLVSGDDGNFVVTETVRVLYEGLISPAELLSLLAARLHRDYPPRGLLNVSSLLAELVLRFPALQSAVLRLVATFSDTLVPLTQNLMMRCLAGGPDEHAMAFLWAGLEDWTRHAWFSSSETPLAFTRHIADLIVFCARSAPNAYLLSLEHAASLIRHLRVSKENIVKIYNLAIHFLHSLSHEQLGESSDLAVALLELAYALKATDSRIDCTPLLAYLRLANCPATPLAVVLCTHHFFTEAEFFTCLRFAHTTTLPDRWVWASTLMCLADYPCISLENENLCQAILSGPLSEGDQQQQHEHKQQGRISLEAELLQKIQDPFVLLLASQLTVKKGVALENFPVENFEIAHSWFVALAASLADCSEGSYRKGTLSQMTRVAQRHPDFAQRVLTAIVLVLKWCNSREVLVEMVDCLLNVAIIDSFCSTRVFDLMNLLMKTEYLLRSLLLPILVSRLESHAQVFPLVVENLSSLTYSGRATKSGLAAYATCVYRLTGLTCRQSYLDRAFSSMQAVFRSRTLIFDFHPDSIALMLHGLVRLIKVQYISPVVVWHEIVEPFVLCNDKIASKERVISACCALAATLAALIPMEDFSNIERTVLKACEYIKHSFSSNPAAALLAWSHFPPLFLRSQLCVSISDCFLQSVSANGHLELNDEMARFVSRWIDLDIKTMPRSLLIGSGVSESSKPRYQPALQYDPTLALLQSKVANWSTNPAIAVAKLKLATDFTDYNSIVRTLGQITALPSLAMQHWLIRIEFFLSLKIFLRLSLNSMGYDEKFDAFIEEVQTNMRATMSGGQSIASVCYAIQIWSLLISTATLVDGNYSRAKHALQLLISTALKEGDQSPLIDLRADGGSEEVDAYLIFGLRALYEHLDETSQVSIEGSLKRACSALRSKATSDSWLWISACVNFGDPNDPEEASWQKFFSPQNPLDTSPDFKTVETFNGQNCTKSMRIGLFLGQLPEGKEISRLFDASLAGPRFEPLAVSGALQYGLGLATASRLGESTDIIEKVALGLNAPGPAIKKLDYCYFLAGVVGVGRLDFHIKIPASILQLLLEELRNALSKASDLRLSSWLLVLLQCISAKKLSASHPTDLKASSKVSRFAEDSAFGICVNFLSDQKSLDQLVFLVLQALNSTPQALPKIDWRVPLANVAARENTDIQQSLDQFLIKHSFTRIGENIHYNKYTAEVITQRAENGHINVSLLHSNLSALFNCIGEDLVLRDRLTMQVIDYLSLHFQRALLLELLGVLTSGEPNLKVLHSLMDCISSRKDYYTDHAICKAIAKSEILFFFYESPVFAPVVRFLCSESETLQNAMVLIAHDSSFSGVVAKELAKNRKILHEMATALVLSLEDEPGAYQQAIVRLIFSVVVELADPYIQNVMACPAKEKLAWSQLWSTDPGLAAKISRRIQKVQPLFEHDSLIGIIAEDYGHV